MCVILLHFASRTFVGGQAGARELDYFDLFLGTFPTWAGLLMKERGRTGVFSPVLESQQQALKYENEQRYLKAINTRCTTCISIQLFAKFPLCLQARHGLW